jgi:hypothetical protein
LSSIITTIAQPTATAAATIVSLNSRAKAIPTAAEAVLPPSTAQGWASGLAGAAKTSTALAPIGATMNGRPSGPAWK